MLQQHAVLGTTVPSAPPIQTDPHLVSKLMRDRCAEMQIDGTFTRTRLDTITHGMRRITGDAELARFFPFYGYLRESYGDKYVQEAGLKHETRNEENKYVFQYIPGAYRGNRSGEHDVSVCGEFLSALHDLDRKAHEISLLVAEQLDASHHSSRYFDTMVERVREGSCVTRVLRYLPTGLEQRDAHPHIDRSLWSIHWGSSHEGLRLFLPNARVIGIRELDPSYAAIFFGRKFAAAASDIKYGCPHGVKSSRPAGEDRYAVVSFFHPKVLQLDVDWLLANDTTMKDYEASFSL